MKQTRRGPKMVTWTPAATKAWERAVQLVAGLEANLAGWKRTGDMRLTVWVTRAAKRGDLDNFLKSCADACNGVLFDDDSQVVELHAYFMGGKPGVTIKVEADE